MKAVTVPSFGGPDSLSYTDVPIPKPAANQLLVQVEAAGVGLNDVEIRRGDYAFMPERRVGCVPGVEVAGTVSAVGEGVGGDWIGRRVFGLMKSGGYCEQFVMDVNDAVPLPAKLSSSDAVGLGAQALTARVSLQRLGVKRGDSVLIRGASGAIGVMAVQMAAQLGASVTAITSSTARGDRLRQLGASHSLDRTFIKDATHTSLYDAILDPVGGADLPLYFNKLAVNGRYCFVGMAAGPPPVEYGMGFLMNAVRSPTLAFYSNGSLEAGASGAELSIIFDQAIKAELKPVIDEVIPLSRAAEAHKKLEAGDVFGKLVLVP